MDFLIQTAWYSIELYGHAMAFHGTPLVLQETPWHSMELYDIPWNSMDLQGNSMEFHGYPWNSINTSWNSMELHGYSMDTPWKFRGIPWIFIDFYGIPWISIDFHGFPWNSEVFHTGSSYSVVPVKELDKRNKIVMEGKRTCLLLLL